MVSAISLVLNLTALCISTYALLNVIKNKKQTSK